MEELDLQKRNQQEQDEFEKNQVILTPGQLIMKQFLRNKLACLGVGIIVFMFLFCMIGPIFSPYGEYEIFYINSVTGEEVRMAEGAVGGPEMLVNVKAPISSAHWLGTDTDGRDVFTRLMYGGRISLTLGFIVVFLSAFIGIIMGGLAGYFADR